MSISIKGASSRDLRFALEAGQGSDATHTDPHYAYAVTELQADEGQTGIGLTFTLADGNEIVCRAIDFLSERLVGREIEELMASFGQVTRELADHHRFRWLGPHKGVVHLALASLANACFDLWAKSRGLPLWRLLLDLEPAQVVSLLDLTYLDDVLPRSEAEAILQEHRESRVEREGILDAGYPAYDTSVGWFHYDDERIRENCRRALDAGFTAMKLKVGSPDHDRDVRRANIVRETAGPDATIMVDANQAWSLPQAIDACLKLREIDPYWVEEPTHPDDVLGHQTLARVIAPTRIALGEHVPNRVVFKNYLLARAVGIVQVDATRVAGVGEFIAVSLLCRKFGVPVVPHVGDVGQIHQHLVLFNHVAIGHEALFLEHIPHLHRYFVNPARVAGGRYRTPQEPGMSCDLK